MPKEYLSGSAPPATTTVSKIVATLNAARIRMKCGNLLGINKTSANPPTLSNKPNGNQIVKNEAKPPGKGRGLKKVIIAVIMLFMKISGWWIIALRASCSNLLDTAGNGNFHSAIRSGAA
jgi:hypothetical protein